MVKNLKKQRWTTLRKMNNIHKQEPEIKYKAVPEEYLCVPISLTSIEHNIIKEGG